MIIYNHESPETVLMGDLDIQVESVCEVCCSASFTLLRHMGGGGAVVLPLVGPRPPQHRCQAGFIHHTHPPDALTISTHRLCGNS